MYPGRKSIREKEKTRAVLLRESILLLRKQYIAYWAAQEKQSLTNAFLDDEHELTEALEHRKNEGLLLESDRLEFMSAISLVHRIAQEQLAVQQRTLSLLKHITGQSIEPFKAIFPQMKSPCTDTKEMADIIRSEHPRLVILKEKIARQEELVRLADKSNLDGHVELVGRVSTETPDSTSGYGVFLNVQFDFPWKAKKLFSAQRKIARSKLDQAKQQAIITESSLLADADDSLQTYNTAQKNMDFARGRLSAAQERIREDLLRLAYLPGDVIEKVEQSRIDAFKTSLDLVEAQAQKLTRQAELLSYTESETPENQTLEAGKMTERYYPESAWKEAVKAIDKPHSFHGLTFYVWDIRRLPFGTDTCDQWFDNIVQLGIKRLLLSFTPQQIAAMQNREQRQSTIQFIRHAREHDIRVELLLGDPSWILPEHKKSLTELIDSFSDIPFQGIHLDLEPDQLSTSEQDRNRLLKQLCDTLRAVKNTTQLPVSLSIHYRYLQDFSNNNFLTSEFYEIGLNEIILMVYISDPQRVLTIAGSILEHYPRLTFSIAQSIEPILSPAESYYKMSRKDFLLKLTALSKQLKYQNFGSLVVQDWQSFLEMTP